MNTIEHIKRFFFWPQIRKSIIHYQQYVAVKKCRKYLRKSDNTDYISQVKVCHPELIGKHVIWQYWSQGFHTAPELVKICTESVNKNCSNYIVIRLDDENIDEYLEIPKDIKTILKSRSYATWSDALRMCLLSSYGGCWLDATIFLTDELPSRYWHLPFFLFQRDKEECRKEYWENVFSLYYGWEDWFKVRVLNSVLFSSYPNEWTTSFSNILLNVFIKEKKLHYFTYQILFNEYFQINPIQFPLENDCIPHYLQQYMNDGAFNIASLDEILQLTQIHKLTYKNKDSAIKLKTLFPEYIK